MFPNRVNRSEYISQGSGKVKGAWGLPRDEWQKCKPLAFSSSAALAAEAEGPEVGSVEEQRQQRGYFVRLGSLSARLRHLAYEHSLGKLRQSKHRTQEMLAQLQETMELVSNLLLLQNRGVGV